MLRQVKSLLLKIFQGFYLCLRNKLLQLKIKLKFFCCLVQNYFFACFECFLKLRSLTMYLFFYVLLEQNVYMFTLLVLRNQILAQIN